MRIDKGVPLPAGIRGGAYGPGRRKFDFTKISHGDSIHCCTKSEVNTLRQSYRSYAGRRGVNAFYLREGAVGADDPRGAGYRVWFVSTDEDAPPIPMEEPDPKSGW